MSTLVTGALGCIGAWVVRALLAEGERPVLFDLGDDPWRMRMLIGPDVAGRLTMVRGDIADRDAVASVVGDHGVTRIVHLTAWQVPLCRQDPANGLITHAGLPIPFPEALDDTRYQTDLGPAPATALADGVGATLDEFERLQKAGRLDARELA